MMMLLHHSPPAPYRGDLEETEAPHGRVVAEVKDLWVCRPSSGHRSKPSRGWGWGTLVETLKMGVSHRALPPLQAAPPGRVGEGSGP